MALHGRIPFCRYRRRIASLLQDRKKGKRLVIHLKVLLHPHYQHWVVFPSRIDVFGYLLAL